MAARGYDCTLKIGTETLGKAADFDPTYTTDSQGITTRDSDGWEEFQGGLKRWTATITTLWVPSEAAIQALWNAYVAGTVVSVVWADEDGNGRTGNAIVTNFHPGPQNQPDAVMCTIELQSSGAVTVQGEGS